jgi:hypothetical protein
LRNEWSNDKEENSSYRVMLSSRGHVGIIVCSVVNVCFFVDRLAVGINILTPDNTVVKINVHVLIAIIVNAKGQRERGGGSGGHLRRRRGMLVVGSEVVLKRT